MSNKRKNKQKISKKKRYNKHGSVAPDSWLLHTLLVNLVPTLWFSTSMKVSTDSWNSTYRIAKKNSYLLTRNKTKWKGQLSLHPKEAGNVDSLLRTGIRMETTTTGMKMRFCCNLRRCLSCSPKSQLQGTLINSANKN